MRLLPLVALFACAACNPEPTAEPGAPSQASATPVPLDAAPSAVATAAVADAASERAPVRVTLGSDGVVLVATAAGKRTATTVPFGRDRKAVLDAFASGFAAPALSSNKECGAGPMTFAKVGALTLNFLDGRFVGWLAEDGGDLVTTDGIRPGIALDALKAERPVTMANGTLEGEFGYATPDGGEIGGFVDRKGKVMSLNAGVNCFFR